ncbi:MAG TPA: tape measure protein [Pyrinomonadaceae bacterium]|nr:tape measure protein [Pyrinomonadaceae bacterium]
MDSNQDSVSLKIQLDISQLPKAQKEASATVTKMYEDQNRQAKEANERAKRYAEEYAAFWLRAMDKIDARQNAETAKRMRSESQYSDWWNRELDKRDRREESSRQRAQREVARINAETRRQAEEQARFHEQMAQRLSQAQQKIQTQQAKWNATDFIKSIGGSGGNGGGTGSTLSGLFGAGGGGNAPPPGAFLGAMMNGGGGGGAAFLGGMAGGALGGVFSKAFEVVQNVYGLMQQFAEFLSRQFWQAVETGARAWLDYSAHMQQVRIGFETLLGSGKAANDMLRDLRQLAVKSPFQFEELSDGARRLLAMGTAASQVNELMTSIGNSVAAIGGRAAEFGRVVYAIGDIQAKGKLTGEEVRQLANNAVPVMKILGEATGKTSAELRKMIEEGKISSDFFIDAFQRYSEIHFGDAMDKQARTFLGALSNIEDGIKQKAETAFKPLFDKISEITSRFGDVFTGDGGLMSVVEDSEAELLRVGSSIATQIVLGMAYYLGSGQAQNAILETFARLFDPNRIAQAVAQGAYEGATGNRWNINPQDVTLNNPALKPWKPSPMGTQVDPLEQQRRQDAINFFSQLTGGDGEKAMEKYHGALSALNDQIENFNAKSHEQHARLQLLKMGFTDLNNETAQAVILAGRQLDVMEKQRREAEKQQKLKDRFDDSVLDAVRGANQKTIDLAMRDASALEEFNVNLALKLKDMGKQAGYSAEAIEFALERIRAALRAQDDAKNVKTAEDEFIRVGKAIDAVEFKLRGASEADEAWLNFLVNSGLQAEYAAGKNEALVTTLDALKRRYKSFAEAQEELKRKQTYDSTIKQVTSDLDQMTEALRKQMDDFGHLEEATPLESFVEGLKHIKDFRYTDSGAEELLTTIKAIQSHSLLDDKFSKAWLDLNEVLQRSAVSAGMAADDAQFFANSVERGLKVALDASAKINPLGERRNALDREYVKLQREVGLAAATAAEDYRNAWQRAINDVQLRDLDAAKSRIKSQVEIADKTNFHSEQVRARFEEHVASMKGYTDIVADAFVGASDKIGAAFSKLFGLVTKHLGAFGDIVNDIATNLFKMVSNRLLMKLVDAMLGGGGGAVNVGGFYGGGQQGMSLGGLIPALGSLVFGGGGVAGGTPGFNPAAGNFFGGGSAQQFASQFFGGGGSQISSLDTFSGQAARGVFSAAGGAKGISTLFGNSATTLGGSLALTGAVMAPFTGLSLGGMLGGQSLFGRGLGMAGGLALGGAGAVALLGGSGAAIFGTGGALSSLGGAAALLTNPFTIGAGVALLAGALIMGRNKRRQEEEKVRNQSILDAKGQIDALIKQVQNHRTEPMAALAQAADIRSKYMTDMQQLKDKKTREHALLTVREIDYKIGQLRAAASNSLNDNARANITAAFASGGVVPGLPGEARLVLAHGGEIIASLAHQSNDFVAAARDAGIPGVRGGDGGGYGRNINLAVELHVGTETRDKLVVGGMESEAGYSVNVKQTKTALKHDIR